jgi:hypothetical protein
MTVSLHDDVYAFEPHPEWAVGVIEPATPTSSDAMAVIPGALGREP